MGQPRNVPLIILGVGGVGRALLEQILDRRPYHANLYNIALQVVAVADRNGACVSPKGLTDAELRQVIAHKAQGGRLADLSFGYHQSNVRDIVDLEGSAESIIVDLTATDATYDALMLARQRGAGIVLANKLPLTRPLSESQTLWRYPRLRYETTVGAAVPVITTAKRLAASGEEIRRIQGSFSGTLGYIMTALEEGMAFSKAVLRAKELGYTEPDPREDLSGRDVARKALILARTLGWDVEMADIQVQSLFPEEWADWSVDDFLAELPTLDADFFSWRNVSQARHEALRYVAKLTPDQVTVGLEFVPQTSPLGRLQGSDNLVEFYTEYYDPQPLALQGRGAGVQATAAGVLSDILELAQGISTL